MRGGCGPSVPVIDGSHRRTERRVRPHREMAGRHNYPDPDRAKRATGLGPMSASNRIEIWPENNIMRVNGTFMALDQLSVIPRLKLGRSCRNRSLKAGWMNVNTPAAERFLSIAHRLYHHPRAIDAKEQLFLSSFICPLHGCGLYPA